MEYLLDAHYLSGGTVYKRYLSINIPKSQDLVGIQVVKGSFTGITVSDIL